MSIEMAWESTAGSWEADSAAPQRGLPAWLLSVMLHVTGMILLAFLPQATSRQVDTKANRVAGIALVQRDRSKTEYLTEDNVDPIASIVSSSTSSPSLVLPSMDQAATPALALALPSATGSLSTSASMPAAGGFTAANQPSRRVGDGQASAQVFGAQGTGSRFVYVFDRSASMQGFQGRPMAASRTELLKSLESLESIHQFQIVFYNDKTSVFNPHQPRPPQLMFGTDENKELAAAFVRNVVPAGATRHLDALRQALGMQPDVIFFLTDAAEPQLTPSELADIQSRNRTGAVINSIEFGSGPSQGGDNFLVKLARQNGGKHVYVDVTRLGR
ncbi:MAG TPA: hypothetical protein QF564_11830 [Pirellulaceae bacterium]|nr:hypothetical protein [Pirellulaceae bacterium]